MNEEEFCRYFKERYQAQIKWYSTRSAFNKKLYYGFQWGVIILSAAVPVLIVSLSENLKWITSVLSILLAIGIASLKSFQFQENWISYRAIAEALKKEHYFYEAGLDDYAQTMDKNSLFVASVESLISRENAFWVTRRMQKENQSKKFDAVG